MKSYEVLIVGGGHGGAQTAIALRQAQIKGSIAIVSLETDPPYERPPLSKDYLKGEKGFERLLIRPIRFWGDRDISLLLGQRVVAVDPNTKTVTTEQGERINYGVLVWAAGGVPRSLTCEGSDLLGIHSLRNRADIDQLVSELPKVKRVVVIGGGYIGLEAASALTSLGKEVVVVEASDRVLARVAGEPLSRFYESRHRSHGVDIRLSNAVASIQGQDGRVSGVRLADGEFLTAQLIVVGIGIEPAVGPLLAAGALGENGVKVDSFCRTTLPEVFAIGDCALHINDFSGGEEIRLESVQNAVDMANVVAKTIAGKPEGYKVVPWFWSNQFGLKLQTVGLSRGYDSIVVRRNRSVDSLSMIYLKNGVVIALDCVNSVKDYVQGRGLVVARCERSVEVLADVSKSLKEIGLNEAND
ncbi:NAD(P)/FAD-dependent oxidoreductase [Caballeronia sp. J97]|uniref:NAD(P)/FAD-dependent oxidoreductase n=1 Tax=Caballeronia sp. J97 TaxID=2805429 RepID=UPI002AB0C6CF|nr:FAD-dependent oxidoreductase [Caballeronia sp. J97]